MSDRALTLPVGGWRVGRVLFLVWCGRVAGRAPLCLFLSAFSAICVLVTVVFVPCGFSCFGACWFGGVL